MESKVESRRVMAELRGRLERWCREAGADERRTVIVRVEPSTPPEEAVREIEAAGVRVESAGAGVITVVADPAGLKAVAALPWVLAVEEPRTLQSRLPKL
jgi:hypothetical protein